MKQFRYLPVLAVASLLGACAGQAPDLNVAEVRGLPQMGDAFHQALHNDYVDLAETEIEEAHRGAADYYNTKARMAAANGNVLPTRMDERKIPVANVRELSDARTTLMRVLGAGGALRATEATSRAQTQFDCWMEEQEENFQPNDISLCRGGFLIAINEASAIVFAAAKPMPEPQVAAKPALKSNPATPNIEVGSFTVYFDHNSSALDSTADSLNKDIADRIAVTQATSVLVSGYTDRSGTQDYNRALSERRTATVVAALKDIGIRPEVNYRSFGENQSAVETADNVREWHNRRVVVTLRK
ncbi:MAG: OmpA family protein [Rhodospirillales bacterium]|nr:OmpA family protein [Rhodospirillales bacterium]